MIKVQNKQQQSPNFKRIVNIYSVNNYKKKKYLLNNNSSISSYANNNNNNSSTTVTTQPSHLNNPNQIYKGEDIKLKL